VAELADALDSGSSGGNFVEVQVLSSAPNKTNGCAAQKLSEALQLAALGIVVTESGSISPSIFVMQTAEDRF
jgi:hypothetical protein